LVGIAELDAVVVPVADAIAICIRERHRDALEELPCIVRDVQVALVVQQMTTLETAVSDLHPAATVPINLTLVPALDGDELRSTCAAHDHPPVLERVRDAREQTRQGGASPLTTHEFM
jgi:hypothetical protein